MVGPSRGGRGSTAGQSAKRPSRGRSELGGDRTVVRGRPREHGGCRERQRENAGEVVVDG